MNNVLTLLKVNGWRGWILYSFHDRLAEIRVRNPDSSNAICKAVKR